MVAIELVFDDDGADVVDLEIANMELVFVVVVKVVDAEDVVPGIHCE